MTHTNITTPKAAISPPTHIAPCGTPSQRPQTNKRSPWVTMLLWLVLASVGSLHCVEPVERGCVNDADCAALARKIYCYQSFCSQQRCKPGDSQDCYSGPQDTQAKGQCQAGKRTCNTEGQWGSCLGQRIPRFEICDRVDNDCDGKIDNDLTCQCTPGETQLCYNGPLGTLQVGQCTTGTQVCETDSLWGKCLGQGLPTAEICDTLDNDCNGLIDEGLDCACEAGASRPCYNPAFGGCQADKDGQYTCVGNCKAGTQTCTDKKQWGKCDKMQLPTPEICDGKDNNCDGKVDEGIPHNEVCDGKDNDCDGQIDEDPSDIGKACTVADAKGICAAGREICAGGKLTCTSLRQAAPEDCTNGEDNDCNGTIDDGKDCECKPGAVDFAGCVPDNAGCTKSNGGIYTCFGICRVGYRTCNANARWGTCVGIVAPLDEKCDGIDNNCDGEIDENWKVERNSVCETGVGVCRASGINICNPEGTGVSCTAIAKSPGPTEICGNLADDNCNGEVDEGCMCRPGDTRPCGVSQGTCLQGTQDCINGQWDTLCKGEQAPVAELCDGKDNDCDGVADEDFPDKNKPCSVGVGECKVSSLFKCKSDGSGVFCDATPKQPSTEKCDGRDYNCNGQIDDGCLCKPGATQACGSDIGECKKGTQTCTFSNNTSAWGPCTGDTTSTTEICDEKDNDCNGQIDEPFGTKGTACTVGIGECKSTGIFKCTANGQGVECNAVAGTKNTEICGDSKDNDCDGVIDNGCVCTNGNTRPCGSATGECKTGTQTCTGGQWGTTCANEVTPVAEICDNLDNDCDGTIDEDFGTLGASCTVGVGECNRTGKLICKADGSGVQCDATPGTPTTELCDGKDNNCNGQIDEMVTRPCPNNVTCNSSQNCPSGNTCGGAQICVNGKWSKDCKGVTTRPAEICDGKDNDCDGLIDEGCQCGTCESDLDCIDGSQRLGVCDSNKRCTFACVNSSCPRPFACDANGSCVNPSSGANTVWNCDNYHAVLRNDSCGLLALNPNECGGNSDHQADYGGVCIGLTGLFGNCSLYCRSDQHCLTGKTCQSNVCR